MRTPIANVEGVVFDSCIGCHSTRDGTVVAAGQLDLSAQPSDIDPDHYRSYRELLSADQEQWITLGDAVADRQRVCTSEDPDGNTLITTETLNLPAAMRAGQQNQSLFPPRPDQQNRDLPGSGEDSGRTSTQIRAEPLLAQKVSFCQ